LADAFLQPSNALWIVKKSEFLALNRLFARSAASSEPNGMRNGDLEDNVAAIVRAGSKQQNVVAISKNFPR
jgi:hypothetical protein